MINSTPQIQLPPSGQTTVDKASELVGYNINNYVFGDAFSNNQQNSQAKQNMPKADKKSSAAGAILLGAITAGTVLLACLKKGKTPSAEAASKVGLFTRIKNFLK